MQKIDIKFDNSCIDFMEERNHSFVGTYKNYVHLHFDEKWKHKDYIKKYTNIEPNEEELLFSLKNFNKK